MSNFVVLKVHPYRRRRQPYRRRRQPYRKSCVAVGVGQMWRSLPTSVLRPTVEFWLFVRQVVAKKASAAELYARGVPWMTK